MNFEDTFRALIRECVEGQLAEREDVFFPTTVIAEVVENIIAGEILRGVFEDKVVDIANDVFSNHDFDDIVCNALTTEPTDYFEMHRYVTKDDVDDLIDDKLRDRLKDDALWDEVDALRTEVAAMKRLAAHAHGALTHLAHIAAQVNTHTTDPEA
jgi:hypothetical protein